MIDLDLVQARADAAHKEVGEIALHGENRWRMSIPAEPSRDSDLIIAGSLQDVPALVAELRAAREDRKELAFAVRDLLDWAKRTHSGIGPDPHPEEYFRTTEHAQRALEDHAPEEAR